MVSIGISWALLLFMYPQLQATRGNVSSYMSVRCTYVLQALHLEAFAAPLQSALIMVKTPTPATSHDHCQAIA